MNNNRISETGYHSAPTRPSEIYFSQDPSFMQNSRLFGSIPTTAGDYSRSFLKPDPDAFFNHGCPTNPFVRPAYPHFPFAVQAMTSAGPRMQSPIQCEWLEVSITTHSEDVHLNFPIGYRVSVEFLVDYSAGYWLIASSYI